MKHRLALALICLTALAGISFGAAKDTFTAYHPPPDPAYANSAAVTPDDNNDLSFVTRGFYVGVAGDVNAILQGNAGTAVVFKAVPAGTVLRIRATRIKSTSTTATNMVALW